MNTQMSSQMNRRTFVVRTLAAVGGAVGGAAGLSAILARTAGAQQAAQQAAQQTAPQAALPAMTVYKSPSCGCCTQWVEHVQQAGFTARTVNTNDLGAVKRDLGVPAALSSCHTVVVGSYLVEGHVPADDIKRLLATRPAVRGLATPGMPVGSPGMEQGDPANYDRYDVLAFKADGSTSVFATHGPPRRTR